MSKYFEKVEFVTEEEQDEEAKLPFPKKEEFRPVMREIWDEISKIEHGGSKFKKATHFRDNTPAIVNLHRFAAHPSEKSLEWLEPILRQDFGMAGEYFYNLLSSVVEKHRAEEK